MKNSQIKDDRIEVTGDLLKHLLGSLRIKIGERIVFVDEDKNRYLVAVTHAGKDSITGNIIDKTVLIRKHGVSINLVQAIPKGPKFDYIIQKSTELGVSAITPVISERCVVRPEKEQAQAKLLRWRRIALEAAQQSNRRDVPEIKTPVTFTEFLTSYGKVDLKILLWEGEKEHGIKDILKNTKDVKSVAVVIGPEGGFSENEVKIAVEKGFTSVSLGESILRTETAPIVILSIILYELGLLI
ncbi:MAG: hypothetical protein A2035_08825 [Nitrospirae bacterium GWA2_42_11]|nr:MAG: hypothetical protein A2035_08825 [Nitrospirae bacterium GWA2_42_11]